MARRILFGLALFCTLSARPATAQTPVPSTTFSMTGTHATNDLVTVTYRAFQNPGDPYRVVCSEPCTADLNAIYGLYAGFAPVYQQIVALFGVAPTANVVPFDMHIDADHWCGPEQPGVGGISDYFWEVPWAGFTSGSYGCFWFTVPGHYGIPFTYPETSQIGFHLLTAHEFTHTEFFRRHRYSYEDFAKAVSFYITTPGGGPPLTDPCDDSLNEVGNGKLIWELCHQSGFQWSHLAPAFTSLDATYNAAEGEAIYLATSVYQFRKALNAAIGKDTLDPFLTLDGFALPQVGDRGTLKSSSARSSGLGGWVSFLPSTGALTSDVPFLLNGRDFLDPPGDPLPPDLYEFDNLYTFSRPNGNNVTFNAPIYVQMKYDPALMTFGTDESTLRLYQLTGTSYQLVADSVVDPSKMRVSGSVPSTGNLVLVASPTLITPTTVIARAVSNTNVHTRAVLRNPAGGSTSGSLTFHPQGVAAGPTDPTVAFSLGSDQTMVLDDLVAAFGTSGAGSVDITGATGSGYMPDVYVTDVEAGTTASPGSFVPTYSVASALQVNERGMLVAPINLQQERLRFVVRTFAAGVTFTVTARDPAGTVISITTQTYGANTMMQLTPATFTGVAAQPNESFDISVSSGSALIFSETVADGMSARNLRLAERVNLSASATDDLLHFPKAMYVTNSDGTVLRTALQITNPGTSTITGHVRFKPAGGGTSMQFQFSLAAGATKTWANIVNALGSTGLGALDVDSTGGPLPIAFARLIYSGNSQPWQVSAESPHDVLEKIQAGDRTVLQAPTNGSDEFLIGVRTWTKPLDVTIVVTDASGSWLAQVTQSFAAQTTSEVTAASLFGMTLSAGEIVEVFVDGGNGLIYGCAANTTTGAVSYQPGKRLTLY